MSEKNEITFEEAMSELEQLVKRLENGNAALEDSLTDYEKAVSLVKICTEKLSVAEKKLQVFTVKETDDNATEE